MLSTTAWQLEREGRVNLRTGEDSVVDSMLQRLRRSVAQRGFWGTAQLCFDSVLWLILPRLRRAERARQELDEEFDRRYGVDTGGIVRPPQSAVVGNNWALGVNYQAVDPVQFVTALNSLQLQWEDFTFIDLGSGKGRTLVLAAEYPFEQVIGVEYCPELNDVARSNIQKLRPANRRCRSIEVVTTDAVDYEFPEKPLVLFLYNPFAESIMAQVVKNLERSYRKTPRRVVVAYLFPSYAKLWEQTGFLKRFPSEHGIFDTGPVAQTTSGTPAAQVSPHAKPLA